MNARKTKGIEGMCRPVDVPNASGDMEYGVLEGDAK